MPFPKYPNKHLEEPLITPEEYRSYEKLSENFFPKKLIITYQRYPIAYFKRKYKNKYEDVKLDRNHHVLKIGDIGFMRINGIGAPHAATVMEELIAGGVREFINLGIAGGLCEEGVFLCSKSVRDEGTSHHYLPDSVYAYPTNSLTNKLGASLKKAKINYTLSPNWTIDAPYMETKKEIVHYKNEGIKTVDMEASALFAVAEVRKVKVASLFVVSDVLGEKWDPHFHKMNLKRTLNQLVDVSLDCFKN